MECEKEFKSKITPQKVQQILNEEGMNLTLEEAADALSFLQEMACITVRKFLNEKEVTK